MTTEYIQQPDGSWKRQLAGISSPSINSINNTSLYCPSSADLATERHKDVTKIVTKNGENASGVTYSAIELSLIHI